MALDDEDTFSRSTLEEWVRTRVVRRDTALDFLAELRHLGPDLNPNWPDVLATVEADIAEDALRMWTDKFRLERTTKEHLQLCELLTIGNFVTW